MTTTTVLRETVTRMLDGRICVLQWTQSIGWATARGSSSLPAK